MGAVRTVCALNNFDQSGEPQRKRCLESQKGTMRGIANKAANSHTRNLAHVVKLGQVAGEAQRQRVGKRLL